jgi:hypothetical protein
MNASAAPSNRLRLAEAAAIRAASPLGGLILIWFQQNSK